MAAANEFALSRTRSSIACQVAPWFLQRDVGKLADATGRTRRCFVPLRTVAGL